jgi:predicted amidohydrolase YtcJ
VTVQSADLILENAAVYTVDELRSWAQAVAICGDRIVYVGSNAGAKQFKNRSSVVMDLAGSMVLPGFCESHAHPVGATDMVLSANLYRLRSVEEYAAAVTEFAAQHPEMPFIRGAGWNNALFPPGGPDKTTLDALARERPVCLRSEDGHSYWCNSKALDMAGVGPETPNPEGGVIERYGTTSEPNGTLREIAAMELMNPILPDYTAQDRKTGLLAYQEMAAASGLTMTHDAHADDVIDAYQLLTADELFTHRFRGSLLVDPDKGPEQVQTLAEVRARHRGRCFQANAAKVFVDGVIEGETAYLLDPYAHRPDYRGELLWDLDNLKRVCAALDREGFQIHVHAIGDAATRDTLDAFEFAKQVNGRRDARHMITHLQIVAPEDIPRFAELGIVGLPQPFWFMKDAYYWNLQLPYLGKARADAEYPMRSFIEAGVVMASGSDFPVTVPNDPLTGIQTGVTRALPGTTSDPDAVLAHGESGVLWPEERVSLDDMIASFTINGAYANFLEAETGSLEVGKIADVIVLDRNLFEIPVDEISSASVLLTLFEGKEVFRAAGFG